MSSWSDNININSCIWFESEDKRNTTAAILAGIFVSIPIDSFAESTKCSIANE